jgi:hypothetical protein
MTSYYYTQCILLGAIAALYGSLVVGAFTPPTYSTHNTVSFSSLSLSHV